MFAIPKTPSNQHTGYRGQLSLTFVEKSSKMSRWWRQRGIKRCCWGAGTEDTIVSVPRWFQTYGSFFQIPQRGCVAYVWAGGCASMARSVRQCGPKMWHRRSVVIHDPPGSWVGEGGISTHDAAQSANNPPRSMSGYCKDGVHLNGVLLSSSFFHIHLINVSLEQRTRGGGVCWAFSIWGINHTYWRQVANAGLLVSSLAAWHLKRTFSDVFVQIWVSESNKAKCLVKLSVQVWAPIRPTRGSK